MQSEHAKTIRDGKLVREQSTRSLRLAYQTLYATDASA